MLAVIQKLVTVSIVLMAILAAWLLFKSGHPLASVIAAVAISLSFAIFLAVEFAALYVVVRRSPADRPPCLAHLVRAWALEVITMPRVFFWRQPFRSQAQADHLPPTARDRRGVVLVHGMLCNRGFWNPWMARLRACGIPFVAVNLTPVFGSIDDYPPLIDAAVQRLTAATGQPVVLVGHSMGGLALRAWRAGQVERTDVHRLITIGTPHGGTWLAQQSAATNGRQMRIGSAWLARLAARETPRQAATTVCFYSDCDNVVFPASRAVIEGASHILVPRVGHLRLAFEPVVFDAVCKALTAASIAASVGALPCSAADQAG